MSKGKNHQIVGVDVTIPAQGEFARDFNQAMTEINSWFKKFVFQLEEGEKTGYRHWQVRGHLIKRKRLSELKKLKDFFPHCNFSVTSSEVHKGSDFNYVMKADSKVDGPWTEKDFDEPPVWTTQLEDLKVQLETHGPMGWQTWFEEELTKPDLRSIHVIYDPTGNHGKSVYCEYVEYRKLGYEIPAMRSMEDIMQCCMCIKAHNAYFIDMPRGMKKNKLGEFYAGIECLKNGVAYDKRYAFKKRRFNRPLIFVFTNMLPDFSLMSVDRWRIHEITDTNDIFHHDINDLLSTSTSDRPCEALGEPPEAREADPSPDRVYTQRQMSLLREGLYKKKEGE